MMRWSSRKPNSRWPMGIPRPCIPTIGTAVPAGAEWLEGVVCGEDGVADFELLHSRKHGRSCFFYAFDLMERSGEDLRLLPL